MKRFFDNDWVGPALVCLVAVVVISVLRPSFLSPFNITVLLSAIAVNMVVALGRNHFRILTDWGVDPDRLRMMRSFDPRSGAHTLDVEDPYYGGHTDFEDVFSVIESALPGLHAWVDARLAARTMDTDDEQGPMT